MATINKEGVLRNMGDKHTSHTWKRGQGTLSREISEQHKSRGIWTEDKNGESGCVAERYRGNMFSLSGIGLGKDLGVCQGEQSNSQSVSAYILHEGMVSEY